MAGLDVYDEDIDETTDAQPDTSEPDYTSQEEMKTSVLYNKETTLNPIIHSLDGMKWSVDYFLQILNVNDKSTPPDINIPATSQKYHRIDNLVIMLDQALEQNIPTELIGTGTIDCGFKVNVNDAFKAELLGGREAIFVVTKVTTGNYNLHQIYKIEFKLFLFLLDNEEKWNDLKIKTMKTYVYDHEHLLDYSAPVILANDYEKKADLKRKLPEIIDYYLDSFINKEKNVLVPTTSTSLYVDTLLMDFLLKIIDTDDHNDISKLLVIDKNFNSDIKYTLWDLIIDRNIDLIKRVNKNIDFKYYPYISTRPELIELSYMGVNFIADLIGTTDTVAEPPYVDISIEQPEDYVSTVNNTIGTYVLSEAFYKLDKENCSNIENLLIDYLNNGTIINIAQLEKLMDSYQTWSTKEQYYLIPILIVLIKDSIINTFKEL
jgi:hypothetical protein